MKPVQLILAVAMVGIVAVYFSRFRSRIFDRLLVLVLSLVGLSMVIAPDWTNRVAQMVGVGRGADLFIYLTIISFSFLFLLFYSKTRELEASFTDLARAIALRDAEAESPNTLGENAAGGDDPNSSGEPAS